MKLILKMICFLFFFPVIFTAAQDVTGQVRDEASFAALVDQYRYVIDEEYIPAENDITALQELNREIEGTPYLELSNEARMLLTIAEEKYSIFKGETAGVSTFTLPSYQSFSGEAQFNRRAIGLGITLGTGLASLGLFNAFSIMGNIAYDRYISTTSARNAAELQRAWMLYDLLKFIFLGTSAASFGASLPFFFSPIGIQPAAGVSPKKLIQNREQLLRKLSRAEKNKDGWRSVAAFGLGTGFTTVVSAAVYFVLAESMYYRFTPSQYSISSSETAGLLSMFNIVGIISGTIGAAGLLTAALAAALPANIEGIEYTIDKIDVQLALEDAAVGDPNLLIRDDYLRERIAHLQEQRKQYQTKLEGARESAPVLNAVTFTALGVGAASLIGTGVSIVLGMKYFDEYSTAPNAADAAAIKQKMDTVDIVSYITGITGTLGIGTSLVTAATRPKEKRLVEEISLIDAKIAEYIRQLGN